MSDLSIETTITKFSVLVDVSASQWYRLATVHKNKSFVNLEWKSATVQWGSPGSVSPDDADLHCAAVTRCALLARWLDERLVQPGDSVTEDEVRAAWETIGNNLGDPSGFWDTSALPEGKPII